MFSPCGQGETNVTKQPSKKYSTLIVANWQLLTVGNSSRSATNQEIYCVRCLLTVSKLAQPAPPLAGGKRLGDGGFMLSEGVRLIDGEGETLGDGAVVVWQASDQGMQSVILQLSDLEALLAAARG